MIPLSLTDTARFWALVDGSSGPEACWPWLGTRHPKGYGRFHADGRHLGAHRLALVLSGVPVSIYDLVCHRCDNPSCCNPKHLFVGTHRDNTRDAIAKGRLYERFYPLGDVCRRGHDMSKARPERDGSRRCRRCRQDSQNARRAAFGRWKPSHVGMPR